MDGGSFTGLQYFRQVLWAVAWLAFAILPVSAQDAQKTRAEKGEVLAQKLCANCHVLPGASPADVPAGIPTFRAIANKPGQTGDHIAQVLIQPHAPMPDLQVSREEIADILAYLETLRTDPAAPAIAPPADIGPTPTPRRS